MALCLGPHRRRRCASRAGELYLFWERPSANSGERSTQLDAEDLIQVLLAIADELDSHVRRESVDELDACPGCPQRDPDMLVWQDDDMVRSASCATEYQPGT